MAFSSFIRKSASSLAPMATRFIRVSKSYHPVIFATSNNLCQKLTLSPFVPQLYFSSATETKKPSSDESLLRVIDSEIKYAKETDDHDRVTQNCVFFFWAVGLWRFVCNKILEN